MRPRPRVSVPSLASAVTALVLGLGLAACSPDAAQDYTSAEVDAAVAELQTLANHRAWEKGIELGEGWAERAPAERELRAWYVYHLARDGRSEEAIAEAETMVEDAPDDAWSLFALARALNESGERGEEALEPSERAFEARPDDVYFARLRADVLRDQIDQEASLEFIATLPPELASTAEILHRKAVAQYQIATRNPPSAAGAAGADAEGEAGDEGVAAEPSSEGESASEMASEAGPAITVEDAYATFAAARAADPEDVESRFLPGAYLINARRLEEGMALVEEALVIAPESPELHRYYWRSITGLPDLTPEEKRERVLEDVERLLEADPDAPAALFAASQQLGDLDMEERQKELEERLLAVAPNSPSAEWVHVYRYREVAREMYDLNREKTAAEEEGDEARVAEIEAEVAELEADYREQLDAFLARDSFHRETLRGDAYRSVFHLIRDDEEIDDEELLEVVRGMAEYEGINTHITHAQAPMLLAEETDHDEEALGLVLEGFGIMADDAADSRDFYDTEGEYDESLRYRFGMMYDALGWVYYQMGREEDAENLLVKATQIRKDQRDALHHLGRLYEDRYDRAIADPELDDPAVAEEYYALAEDYYIQGAGVQGMGENPNDEALEKLYEKRYGSMEGFETYMADVEARDRQRRMQKVLEARLEEPWAYPAFELASLDGETWSSEDLAGKIVVMNFWGVWCGPCVAEMPDIQEFHERYEGDPRVVFLTINNDPNPDDAREYMAENEFTFPVLIDDGYLNEAGMHTFPTSWFVASDGSVEYVKEGWSEALVEEFGWRVEDLKDEGATAS